MPRTHEVRGTGVVAGGVSGRARESAAAAGPGVAGAYCASVRKRPGTKPVRAVARPPSTASTDPVTYEPARLHR
ncbi:hypothetical protein Xph01_32670 [Micromonospora phaseoli]|nr:hypothetical protein Xph01_32670 [Micromonospora phaseoli]